jgi:SRSO17 transposase
VWTLDSLGRRRDDAVTVAQLGKTLGEQAFRRVTWRTGTKMRLSSRFVFRRVKSAHADEMPIAERAPIWLVIEWLEGEESPTKFYFTTLARRMTKKQIVRVIKERWKTERVYQELKGELGFDHFEGRSFRGWHHHVSVVLCCYAFVIAERARAFSPSAAWAHRIIANALAA